MDEFKYADAQGQRDHETRRAKMQSIENSLIAAVIGGTLIAGVVQVRGCFVERTRIAADTQVKELRAENHILHTQLNACTERRAPDATD